MCNCKGRDQTSKKAVEIIQSMLKDDKALRIGDILGSGLFLVADPKSGILEYATVVVFDLSYEECRKRGANCIAFKFLPKTFITYEKVKSRFEEASQETRSRDCFEFCAGAGLDCPWDCFCPDDLNYCQ